MKKSIKLLAVITTFSLMIVSCNTNSLSSSEITSKPKTYTITWKNYDGSILETDDDVLENTVPTYDGSNPTRKSNEQFSYTFSGWTPTVEAATSDKEYVATYVEKINAYTVTWKNYDGTILKTDTYNYGEMPTYSGNEPVKDANAQYVYTFSNWEPAIKSVTGDITYTAKFKQEIRNYTVTWKNYDGTVLEVDKDVPYGTFPEYNGFDPHRENTERATYTFRGWSPELAVVNSDQTYTATYSVVGNGFVFSQLPYKKKAGYENTELQGAPWINSDLEGQLNAIEKPSLKDDFFANINYDAITKNIPGYCEKGRDITYNYMYEIVDGSIANGTTNGAFFYSAIDKMYYGAVAKVTDYLNNFNLESYITSKELFTSFSSILKLVPYKDGYQLSYNDGYIGASSYGIQTLWLYRQHYSETVKSALNKLSEVFEQDYSATDINNVGDMEYQLSLLAYSDYSKSTKLEYNSYTVNNFYWGDIKEAMLDLGLKNNDRIYVPKYYNNSLNYFFNNYLNGSPTVVEKLIKERIMFDARFLMGVNNYRELNAIIVPTNLFTKESGIGTYSDQSLAYAMDRACFGILDNQTYIEMHASEQYKEEVTSLIKSVLGTYEDFINNSWLSDAGKEAFLDKLRNMKYESCYSDAHKSFPKLNDTNLNDASIFDMYRDYVTTIASTIPNKNCDLYGLFDIYPNSSFNSFYFPGKNAFVILDAMASVFKNISLEEKYGALASIIAHEITHAFDPTGVFYDENGMRNSIISSRDSTKFNTKVSKLNTFYNQIALKKDYYVEGANVNKEATADMGGLKVALLLAKKHSNFDYVKFFTAFAESYKNVPLPESQFQARVKDGHPFSYLRVNVTLGQVDEFYETFDIQPGDGMYIPENKRVSIW